MNFFEDLVEELKKDNLLEDTVMDAISANAPRAGVAGSKGAHARFEEPSNAEKTSIFQNKAHEIYVESTVEEMPVADDSDLELAYGETTEIRKAATEKEFFQKRAIGEVSSLKMVEHILTAVEREYMKIVPSCYDDFGAKVALNNFLQVTGDISSDKYKHAEFAMMQETEAWCSALAKRDEAISVGDVRRYCENAKPMLSSQAMLALARFYRNLPYSESVRGKFDFLITKLFSRPTNDQTRKLLFSRDEMLSHVKTLYAEWSSISLYIADEDDTNAALTVNIFEDLAAEAAAATEFDDLIRSDFFNRLRLFKESITELFFAPAVTAAAIACNTTIANAYVQLIDREKEKSNAAIVHDKYAYVDEAVVSDATGRTLMLVDLLQERTLELDDEELDDGPEEKEEKYFIPAPTYERAVNVPKMTPIQRVKTQFLGMNRALIAVSVLLLAVSAGMYVWANYFIEEPPIKASVRNVDISNSPFKGELGIGRVSGETLYGVLLPTWQTMTKEKRQDLLQRIHQAGAKNGWSKVNLMDATGKTVAFSSATRMELVAQ